jgi:ribulose-5-phosphate 4-epimerase/fuculose-1-phosphate aldolase
MAEDIAELLHQLIVTTRILANEEVLDAFGHVSVRHPHDPKRYFISRHRAPELVELSDLIEMNLDSEPVRPTEFRLYSERVIHGEIYKARPDVNAVVHHHAHAMLPYAISGRELVPVFHLGAVIGSKVPFWDQRDEFGDTNMLVVKPEEGASLARALGPHWMVLMRRHGATVVGANLHELVFRSIYSCLNAVYLSEGRKIGRVGMLTPGEIEMAGAINKIPSVPLRTWEYWARRLAHRGGMPPGASAPARNGSSSRPRGGAQTARQAGKRGRIKGRKKR